VIDRRKNFSMHDDPRRTLRCGIENPRHRPNERSRVYIDAARRPVAYTWASARNPSRHTPIGLSSRSAHTRYRLLHETVSCADTVPVLSGSVPRRYATSNPPVQPCFVFANGRGARVSEPPEVPSRRRWAAIKLIDGDSEMARRTSLLTESRRTYFVTSLPEWERFLPSRAYGIHGRPEPQRSFNSGALRVRSAPLSTKAGNRQR
jgi:hypothetical protein